MTTPRDQEPGVSLDKVRNRTADAVGEAQTQVYQPPAGTWASQPYDAGPPPYPPTAYPPIAPPPSYPAYPSQAYPQQYSYPQQPGYPPAYPQPGIPPSGHPQQYYSPYGPYGPPASPSQTWSISSFICIALTVAGTLMCFVPVIVTGPLGIILGVVGHAKGEPLGKWAAIINGVVLALVIVLVLAFVGLAGLSDT